MNDQFRASWHAAKNGRVPGREALERMTTHRLIVGLRGYAAILRDVAGSLDESKERTDILFVADRLSRSVPELEERVGQVVEGKFQRKSANGTRYKPKGSKR